MAGFEDLIRGALQKQGDPTPEKRTIIYNSSRQALERMLSQNSTLNADAAASQRARLETAITQIENDYTAKTASDAPIPKSVAPRIPTPPPPPVAASEPETAPVSLPVSSAAPAEAPAPTSKPAAAPAPAPAQTPAQAAPQVSSQVSSQVSASGKAPAPRPISARIEPAVEPPQNVEPETEIAATPNIEIPTQLEPDHADSADTVRLEDYPESYKGSALQERRPYAKLLLWAIILAGVGVAVWWAVNFGPALIQDQLDGSVPNPRPAIETGSFNPGPEEGWVTAFSPANDSANIDTSGNGTADLFQDGDKNFIRLASNAGSSRNNLRIKIPKGVMLPLKGKAATFEVMLKNTAEESHQFALFCEFGAMGNCGRKRFTVTKKSEAFIFDVLVKDADLLENEDAYISINTDLVGGGNAVDLFSIRVRSGG